MYEAFFGFRQRPFPAVPNVQFYFPVDSLEKAKTNLVRAIERAEGVGLVIGPAGTGKSMLCYLIADYFRHQFQVAMLSNSRLCSRRTLLQSILFELKLPYRDMEEGELRLSLIDHVEPSDRCPHGILLVVDEAHTLPLRLLEEIRMITNLVRGGQPRVRLLLAGDPQLEERLAAPKLASFQQRIAARCYLHNLSQSETAQFVRHHIRLAGIDPDQIFDDVALVALHHATDGVPRFVNQVCDHALVLACAGGQRRIDSRGVEDAWADLQQLPTPWASSPGNGHQHAAVIEFGHLNDHQNAIHSDSEEEFMPVFDGVEPESTIIVYDGNDEVAESDVVEDLAVNEQPIAQPATAPRASDPFGGPFADEEVIFDRYAAWDAELRRRPHVRSSDGEQIAAALRSAIGAELREPVENSLASSVQEIHDTAQEAIGAIEVSPPVTDPDRLVVAPQIVGGFGPWDEQWWTAHVLVQPSTENWTDDRDMVIVEDGPATMDAPAGTGRDIRQAYRRLFGQLRGG